MIEGALDVGSIRDDFPLLSRLIEGRRITYLDSAATSAKPRAVLEAMNRYYEESGANIHRGKHTLSEESSDRYEAVRRQVARFINASPREVIFTSGTTASLNLVALGLGLRREDNVVTTLQEHHSNFLPWLDRAEVRVLPVGHEGSIDLERLFALVDERTKLIAISLASNVTGAIHPVRDLAATARARGVPVIVDAAQAAPHMRIDVEALGCDYLAFSSHKMLGPTGVGVLWGRSERLEALGMPIRGGGTVSLVRQDGYVAKPLPYRLEPGTPNIAGVIGFGAALTYLETLGLDRVRVHEEALADRLIRGVSDLPGTTVIGPPPGKERLAIASVVIASKTIAPDQIAMLLSDGPKIMVRSGHHCCHPYFDALGTSGAVRASAYVYNTLDEIDLFSAELRSLLSRFHK
jgi:cysteine desulfurase / selenocysteine lyase